MIMNDGYELFGMTYKGYLLNHDSGLPMHKVLKELARWLKDNEKNGTIEAIKTYGDPDDENRLITTIIWAN